MSAGSDRGAAGNRTTDRLVALITGLERPTANHVDELLLAWRHAQQEATDAYARWHELTPRHGHTTYLAALDREERAAGVYAEVRRRALLRERPQRQQESLDHGGVAPD